MDESSSGAPTGEPAKKGRAPSHTPGPWITRLQPGIDADCPASVEIGQPAGFRLFVTAVQPKDGDVELCPRNVADAMLIAAAPDLLEVAEAVALRGHAEGCISRGRGNVPKGACDCLCGPAQVAIAKARGT